MISFDEIEKQIENGFIFRLNQFNRQDFYGICYSVQLFKDEKSVFIQTLDSTFGERLGSIFPNTKDCIGFHAFYFYSMYDSNNKTFSSSVMRKNFDDEDSVFASLTGNSSSFIGSLFELERKAADYRHIQREKLFEKRKAC